MFSKYRCLHALYEKLKYNIKLGILGNSSYFVEWFKRKITRDMKCAVIKLEARKITKKST